MLDWVWVMSSRGDVSAEWWIVYIVFFDDRIILIVIGSKKVIFPRDLQLS